MRWLAAGAAPQGVDIRSDPAGLTASGSELASPRPAPSRFSPLRRKSPHLGCRCLRTRIWPCRPGAGGSLRPGAHEERASRAGRRRGPLADAAERTICQARAGERSMPRRPRASSSCAEWSGEDGKWEENGEHGGAPGRAPFTQLLVTGAPIINA